MATEAVINKRQAEAEASVKALVSALAEHHGIELAESAAVRDPKMQRVLELETLSANLGAMIEASQPKPKAETKADAKTDTKTDVKTEVKPAPKGK